MRHLLTLTALLVAIGPARAADPPPVKLDVARYELGRRLKAFEDGWDKVTDPAARKRAVAEMEKVHTQFLSFRLAEAARTLDRATHALMSDQPMTPAEGWAAALIAVPEKRLIGAGTKEVGITVRPLYKPDGGRPAALAVRLGFADADPVEVKPDDLPATATVPLPAGRGSADLTLTVTVEGGGVTRKSAVGVSVDHPTADLRPVRFGSVKWPAPASLEEATAKELAALFARLHAGEVPETDLPAGRLAAEFEELIGGEPYFTADRAGDRRVWVPLGGKRTAPVRVFVPKGLDPKKPVPVVVGLHGAGGSENLFFEGYGRGLAVEECEKRGWVFVGTRSGFDFGGGPPVVEILDQLSKRYPLDPKRTFLVGHSMGAGQAVALAGKQPGRFAGVAALGGGGRISDVKPFAGLPLFVAAGEKDFGLLMARGLNKGLTAGGAKAVTYKEYPGVEHLLIVREALPDVFTLFDRVAKGP